MILANGCNITKSEKFKGVWILSVPTVYHVFFIFYHYFFYIIFQAKIVRLSASKSKHILKPAHIVQEEQVVTPLHWECDRKGVFVLHNY